MPPSRGAHWKAANESNNTSKVTLKFDLTEESREGTLKNAPSNKL